MFITDKEIKRVISDSKNFRTGQQYYKKGYVKIIDIEEGAFFGEYEIEATVDNGSHESEVYITVKDNKIISYSCDCYWCDEFSACGHVAAVLFKIQELSPDEFPFRYEEMYNNYNLSYFDRFEELMRQQEERMRNHAIDATRGLISNFKQEKTHNFNQIKNNQKYSIEVQVLNDYKNPRIKFKVGADKKYVIKNIHVFLNAIDNNVYYEYGKNLAFVHNLKVFDEESLQIIDMMRNSLIACEQYEQKYFYNPSPMTNEIDIVPDNIDYIYDVLSKLEKTNLHLLIDECDYRPTIIINKYNDYFVLKMDELATTTGRKNIYQIKLNQIEKSKLDENGKAVKLINYLERNDGLYLSNEDVDDFCKYIFNDVKEYFNLEGDILLSNVVNNEVLTLFGDIDEHDQIKVYLESKQDNHVIYSFNHPNQQTSVNFDLIEDYLESISDVIDYENHCMYMNLDNENTYTFLNEGLPFLADYCEILVSEELNKIGKKSQFSITVGVTIENDLLAIDIDSVDIPKEELALVLNSYQKKKKFHRLKNGRLLYLESDELEELDDFMNDYNLRPKMIEDGHLDMNMYRAFSIDDKADHSNYLDFDRSSVFKDVIDNLKNVKNQEYPISPNYNNILRDYQKFGYQWLQSISSYGFGGILADDMGLGKTLQMISLLDQNKDTNKTSLVICPSSLLLNWEDEIHKFSDTLTCTCVHGPLKQRKLALASFNDVDVLITTYDYIRRDVKLYENYQFEYIVLDEAQYIKNPKTKNATAVKSLNGKHRFALTGTPIENSLAELWSIFDFLMPDYLFNYHYFRTNYETPIVKNHDEKKQNELKKLITPFILRRNKKDVLTELPEKIEKTLSLEFSDEEKKLYLANLVQVNKELQEQLHYDNVDRIAILAMLTRLRQICCEPRTIYENITNISSKLEGCLDLIRNFLGNNQKVLLFSSFTSVLDLIANELDKEGISYYQLTGSTKKEERHELVNKFQHDDTTVFLISLKAGGTGLNLTAAEAVIHFDPWWNMSAQNQATDRAHRIGQENVVTVYRLVMKDSVEEKILELQNKKKNLADSFVENNDGAITTMSTDDIIELFKV